MPRDIKKLCNPSSVGTNSQFPPPQAVGETSNEHLRQQTWKIINIFEILEQANPEPKTELEYTNPFTLLVAVILSAQSTDKGVNKATKELFKVAETPEDILAMGEAGLKKHIKTIGLFNSKARNIIAMCEILERDFSGQVPRQMEYLVKLPGVGRKTANVLLNTIWGEPLIAVDTHVFRVARRLRLAEGATPQAVERELGDKIPDRFKRHAHHWLILHGRYICKARTPLCQNCPISRYCEYYKDPTQ